LSTNNSTFQSTINNSYIDANSASNKYADCIAEQFSIITAINFSNICSN